MSVHHFLEEAGPVYGNERDALGAEVELITRVVRRVAGRGSARVIDMLDASRGASLRTSSRLHRGRGAPQPPGNAALGKLVATRIVREIERAAGRRRLTVLFHTLDFAAFFGVVVLLYGLLGGRWLLLALTGASYFFYGYSSRTTRSCSSC